ncbi:PAP/fibrillin family protein [Anabaena cylindrica FACHB-243]|uniref:PAP fibrillin family protein n=1 Tax=Anabaena cylindrica (strain ATCC 27899 / PCC 7122) TaxID=272123 RepID=K9ZEQ2_ANACC|nr:MULTISPECIES: PAP/fibrillin family protein [Anabaena]AFZ57087.1 PAP fibrillin family protein [Anabaena cylindrica PCC 7122]MBD2421437.1 PAP/fibrillin family protein [Anabaena cylindrica FACHB-243]MBY5283148.1 fibrillin [Anabaena sp. CCAP 1446/1C]MBY5309132.1 fibrillin [Anabaena sp. CCAP 1446/1C]MCM2407802.1 PAP/fibrillin family protein [Anabaena sp. CCAP 1446/1C]
MIVKSTLLNAIAPTNRGLLATETQKQAILAAIASLEDFNPTPRPLEATHLLEGNWRLLYTTSKALLNLDRFPLYKLGQIYQSIRVETTSVYNIAEIYGLPSLEGLISVAAKFEPVSERRVQVKFQRSIIGLQKLIDYKSPAEFIQQIESGQKFTAIDFPIKSDRQQGWLDITYIDQDLRIGRGNEGSVFVLSKS